MRGKIKLLALSAASLVLLAQCGLERPITPWGAPTPVSTSGTTYIFRTASDHFDSAERLFMGYEVYYKIAESDTLFINNSDLNLTDPAQLESHGFKRMHSSTDTWYPSNTAVPPLLRTDDVLEPFGPYDITLDFTGILVYPDTTEASASSPGGIIVGGPIYLRRFDHSRAPSSVPAEYGRYKRFNALYSTDTDVYPATYLSTFNNYDTVPVYMAIYVFAYGKSLNNQTFMQDIKSPLCNLSYNSLNFYYHDEQP